MLMIIKPNYQLIFSHGIINPLFEDQLTDMWIDNDSIRYKTDDSMHLFYFEEDSEILEKQHHQSFFNNAYDYDDNFYTDEYLFDRGIYSLRSDLTFRVFLPPYRRSDRARGLNESAEKVETMYRKLITSEMRDGYKFNPIFTFGHDLRYEVIGLYITDRIPVQTSFNRSDVDYYGMINKRQNNNMLKSRIFGVDGANALGEFMSGGAIVGLSIIIAIIILIIIIIIIVQRYKKYNELNYNFIR